MNEPESAMHPHHVVDALPTAFAPRFRIRFYEDTVGSSQWQQSTAKRQEDPRRIVRLVAQKVTGALVGAGK